MFLNVDLIKKNTDGFNLVSGLSGVGFHFKPEVATIFHLKSVEIFVRLLMLNHRFHNNKKTFLIFSSFHLKYNILICVHIFVYSVALYKQLLKLINFILPKTFLNQCKIYKF